jgi:hypothetical protein
MFPIRVKEKESGFEGPISHWRAARFFAGVMIQGLSCHLGKESFA